MSRYWLIVLLQLVFACSLVYIGWEVLTLVVEPKGSNWMWVAEMNIFCVGLGSMMVCSGMVVSRVGVSPQRIRIAYLIQVALLTTWYFLGRDIFPYQHLYLLLCGVVSMSMPVVLTYLPKGWNWSIEE